jgi:hypothetical protein
MYLFLFSKTSKLNVGLTEPPNQLGEGANSQGVKLTIRLHQVPNLIQRAARHPFPCILLACGPPVD